MDSKYTICPEIQSMFNAAIVFRCLAILQVFLLIISGTEIAVSSFVNSILLSMAVTHTLILFVFRDKILTRSINGSVFFIIFILIDLVFDFFLMCVGGGWRNSWYIYTFNTTLIAATFKKIKGALSTAAILSLIYIASLAFNGYSIQKLLIKDNLDQIISNVVSYFFIGGFFAYPAILLEKLHQARVALENKTLALKEADDVINHFKSHSVDLKEAILSYLQPENILKAIGNDPSLIEPDNKTEAEAANNGNISRIKGVVFKENPLTIKEIEVLSLITDGLTNQEIAAKMATSAHTIDSHRRNIYQKLGVKSSAQAIVIALSNNLLEKNI